jgi:hypothetical protein
MGHTFAEKVLARKAGLDSVVPGQIVTVRPNVLGAPEPDPARRQRWKRWPLTWVRCGPR